MTIPSVRPIESMAQLVAKLDGSIPNQWLLADLPAEAQAHIAHDRIFWFEGLNRDNFNLEKFVGLHTDKKRHYHYVWIEIGQHNEIIVVGRTKFKASKSGRGDLFKDYRVRLDKSAAAIAEVLYGASNDTKIAAPFAALQNEINAYVKGAIVIPLDLANAADADWLESQIGDVVVAKYGALNPNSHHYGRGLANE